MQIILLICLSLFRNYESTPNIATSRSRRLQSRSLHYLQRVDQLRRTPILSKSLSASTSTPTITIDHIPLLRFLADTITTADPQSLRGDSSSSENLTLPHKWSRHVSARTYVITNRVADSYTASVSSEPASTRHYKEVFLTGQISSFPSLSSAAENSSAPCRSP